MQGFAFELCVTLYATAVGFVTAGILASFVQLVSGEPLRFGMEAKSMMASILAVLLYMVAGPAILMRNNVRAVAARSRSAAWLGLSVSIAGFWSLMSGLLVLDVMLSL